MDPEVIRGNECREKCLARPVAIQAGQQRFPQRLAPRFVQRAVVLVGQAEHVLHPLAEGGDARVVHPQLLFAQHVGDIGQQARAVGADQAEDGLAALADLLERILPRKPMSAYGATQADVEVFAVSTIENQQRLLARAYVPVTLDVARAIEQECL